MLKTVALLALRWGPADDAIRLLRAADAINLAVGLSVGRSFQVDEEPMTAAIRTAPLQDASADPWNEGHLLSLDKAIDRAIAVLDGIAVQPTSGPDSARVPATPGARDASGFPDGLSAREPEIPPLIADGLTNRQIGDRRFLSVRTVERHATSAYRKIGVHGQVAAIAHVLRTLT